MSKNYSNEYSTEEYSSEAETPGTWGAQPARYKPSSPPVDSDAHPVAHAPGFSQTFGLHAISGLTTLAANTMLFGGVVMSMGTLAPVAILVAVVLGYITYRAQRRFYGDDHDAALVKALAVGLLTAIPVGLPAFLTVPSTVVGVIHTLRRKHDKGRTFLRKMLTCALLAACLAVTARQARAQGVTVRGAGTCQAYMDAKGAQ
jgi:hypothetical protein